MHHEDGHGDFIEVPPKRLRDVPRSAGSITSPRRSAISSPDDQSHQLDGGGSQVVKVPGSTAQESSTRKGTVLLPLYQNHHFAESKSKEVDGVYECMGLSYPLDHQPFDDPASNCSISSSNKEATSSHVYQNYRLKQSELPEADRDYESIGPTTIIDESPVCCHIIGQSYERILEGPSF